jgi:hypothetical protein
MSGLWAAGRRSLDRAALALLLTLVVWWWFVLAIQGSPSDWAFDFRQFWQGGSDVVAGISPYPSAELLATAGGHLGPEGIRDVFRFPYPAGAAIALAPFGALSFEVAAAVWSALLILSLLASLWILGVRDWRVLAVVVTAAPVISAVRLGTLTPLLVLALAVVWRWRDRRWVAGAALALAISLKLLLWPLVVWLAATRRYAAAVISAGGATALTFGVWAALGFSGLGDYPELLRRLADVVGDRGYSLVALGVQAGLSGGVATALPWVVGLALLVAVAVLARKGAPERVTYSLAVLAAIAITPIVWLHYFALLVVPLAVARPRFALGWMLLWVFWATPVQQNEGDLWRVVVALAVAVVAIALTWRAARPAGSEAA